MKVRVVPIYERGNKERVSSFRYTNIGSSIFFQNYRVSNFLNERNVSYDSLFGYLPGRSTTRAFMHSTGLPTCAFEMNHFMSGTLLDLKSC